MSATFDPQQRILLLEIARAAVISAVTGSRSSHQPDADWLRAPGACFVTLTVEGELHGCVGSLEPRRTLGDDVRSNAMSAAIDDPRFPPLREDELDDLVIEISLLSRLERILVRSEADALAKIEPHRDGLVIRHGLRRGTLLPQVWEDLPDPADFLMHLKRKAGLAPAFWDEQVELYRYSVSHWSEADAALRRANTLS